jgi:predicted phosphodiesterase
MPRPQRIAALYDIHGNLSALDAVLAELEREAVDQIVVGGDIVLGPMPRETLERMLALERPVAFLHGNCELSVLAQMAAPDVNSATYWGTVSGNPPPDIVRARCRWTAQQLQADFAPLIASWPKTLEFDVEGVGRVLFCHSTPRSETEVFTRRTPEEVLRPLFDPLGVSLVVCGHTHMQFDRVVGTTRVVNAGSVGSPYGATGAHWALLGPDVQLRRTAYDLARAAEKLRATAYPDVNEVADEVLKPMSEEAMLEYVGPWELKAT